MPDQDPNLTDDSSKGGDDFRSQIPEEFRSHPTLAPYKSLGDLVKSHISVNEMVGKNRLAIPDEKADEKTWGEFWAKLGRPETPDKYGLKKPDNFPEGLSIPDKYLQTLATAFHKHGLTPRQAQGIFSAMNEFATTSYGEESTQTRAEYDRMMGELRTEFGDQYSVKIDLAKRAVSALVDKKGLEFMNEMGLNTHPQMIRIFAAIGDKLQETMTDGGTGAGGQFGGMSPSQAQAEINALYADQGFMRQYTTQHDPGHKQAVEKMLNLQKIAHPEKPKE